MAKSTKKAKPGTGVKAAVDDGPKAQAAGPAGPAVKAAPPSSDTGAATKNAAPETPPVASAAAPVDTQSSVAITVTGPNRGRRRAGRDFGPVPETILLDDLSDADLDALKRDPRLSVVFTSAPSE